VADHELGQLGLAGFGGQAFRHDLAAAKHHDAVGRRHNLIQLVRDEDQRQPLLRHVLERPEQPFGLDVRQDRINQHLPHDDHRLHGNHLRTNHPVLT